MHFKQVYIRKWSYHDVKFSFTAELTATGNRSELS